MIAHVVCFKMKPYADGNPKDKNLSELLKRLENLKNEIPQVKGLSVKANTNGGEFDAVLTELFEDEAALAAYDASAPHIRIKEYIGKVCEEMVITDCPF